MDIRIFSPSYNRADLVKTQAYLPFVKYVIHEFDQESYKAKGHDVIVCPDEIRGNIARVRNWILDQNKVADCVVMLDDDIKAVTRWRDQKIQVLTPDEVRELIEVATVMTLDMGIHLWGVNCIIDKGAYREYTPFSLLSYCSATFCGHVRSELRYDERFSLKEDYDMTLQQIHKYGRVLRFNMISYKVDHYNVAGGCSVYRNSKKELEQIARLQAKWGKKVVQIDEQSKKGNDFNPILKVPIRGV